ncbi:hypothetical protein D3C87_1807010 [compost metagenome]
MVAAPFATAPVVVVRVAIFADAVSGTNVLVALFVLPDARVAVIFTVCAVRSVKVTCRVPSAPVFPVLPDVS